MAITTATSASPASNNASAIKGEPASPASASASTSPSNDIKPAEAPVQGAKTESATTAPTTGANANGTQPPKRRAARRANTAERRATHNAVERMRRETLNGRFLEVNEWRARARVPQLDIPVRSDAHQAVLRAELEDFDLTLEEGLELEEGDEEDGDLVNETNDNASPEAESPVSPQQAPSPTASSPQEQFKRARSASTMSTPGSSHGHPAGFFAPVPSAGAMLPPLPIPQTPIHARGAGRFAFDAPPASPSAASSASGGWDGPATPPASAGAMHPGMMMPPQMLEQQHAAMMGGAGKGFYDAPHSAGAGAAYDLGLGFDGEESLLLGGGGMGANGGMNMGMGWAHANPAHPAFHAAQAQQQAQAAIRLREVYEQQQQMLGMQMSAAGMGVPMQMQMQMGVPMGMGGMQMGVPMGGMGGMQMGMGVPVGVAQGQYLHQPTRFA